MEKLPKTSIVSIHVSDQGDISKRDNAIHSFISLRPFSDSFGKQPEFHTKKSVWEQSKIFAALTW